MYIEQYQCVMTLNNLIHLNSFCGVGVAPAEEYSKQRECVVVTVKGFDVLPTLL